MSSISTIGSAAADAFFSASSVTQDQLDSLSNSAFSRGIADYTNGDIEGAIVELRRGIGLSPYSNYTLQAYQYMAAGYQKQGNDNLAIKAYQDAAKLFPRSDVPHAKLGLIYFNQKKYKDAETEYAKAVELNPNQASNVYSLGQTYIAEGKYSEAEAEFKKVSLISPKDPSSYYALGQTYRKMGRYGDAAAALETAVSMDPAYSEAHLELGLTYTDMKRKESADSELTKLSDLDATRTSSLQGYIKEKADPKMVAAYSLSGFNTSMHAGISISSFDDTLTEADASQTFSVNFTFSKQMDTASVQNVYNWLITRASGTEQGGAYNWGLPTPDTEVSIDPLPLSVTYDSSTLTAKVMFRLTQNSDASGTIDPSHIMFKFGGKDTYGNSMDRSADQFSGLSKIV